MGPFCSNLPALTMRCLCAWFSWFQGRRQLASGLRPWIVSKSVPSQADFLTRSEKLRIVNLRKSLLTWYQANGRDLPWRYPSVSTYQKICVEVLLQRTRAETVAKMYAGFFSRFPGWGALANAPDEELETVLKPIGLWRRRAQSLKALAAYAANTDGYFPADPAELSLVPAVGQYVGNAIRLFQHGQAVPLVDVNMARVLERYLRQRQLADIRYDPWLQAAALKLVDCEAPVEVNWATLDFAALRCKASRPICETCQLQARCNTGRRIVR